MAAGAGTAARRVQARVPRVVRGADRPGRRDCRSDRPEANKATRVQLDPVRGCTACRSRLSRAQEWLYGAQCAPAGLPSRVASEHRKGADPQAGFLSEEEGRSKQSAARKLVFDIPIRELYWQDSQSQGLDRIVGLDIWGCTVAYYVYENWVAEGHKARIHFSHCSYCNDGEGVHSGSGDRNGRWLGPFDMLQGAVDAAHGTGGNVSKCKLCCPY